MRFWTHANIDQHSKEIITEAETGEMQVIGMRDRLPIIILPFDKLFEPDRSKWVNFQLDISQDILNNLVREAEEKDIAVNDLIVLLIFEFIASRKIDAFLNNLNDTNAPLQED